MLNEKQIKLIGAAEIEFAEKGFEGASVRAITQRANMNIAAINYHFGSKEALFIQMIRYHVQPINELRLRMLNEAKESRGGGPVPIEQIVEIMIRPFLSQIASSKARSPHFIKAIGRCLIEDKSFMAELKETVFAKILVKFQQMLRESLGDVNAEQLHYAIQLTSCLFVGVFNQYTRFDRDVPEDSSADQMLEQRIQSLVAYTAAGIKGLASQSAT